MFTNIPRFFFTHADARAGRSWSLQDTLEALEALEGHEDQRMDRADEQKRCRPLRHPLIMLCRPSLQTSDVAREHVLAPGLFLLFRHFAFNIFISLRD